MKRRLNTLLHTLTLAAFALPMLSSSAAAQTADHGPALDIFGGYYGNSGSSHPRAFGVARLVPVLRHLGRGSRVLEGGRGRAGLVRGRLRQGLPHRYQPLRDLRAGRAGIFRARSFGETFNQNTVHLGLGAEIGLGARAYLRPEVRGRWATDEITWDARLTEYTLGFGWRF